MTMSRGGVVIVREGGVMSVSMVERTRLFLLVMSLFRVEWDMSL